MSQTVERAERGWAIHSGEDIGRAIAEIRREMGLTQTEFAQRIGLNRNYLAAIEAGRSGRLLELMLRVLRRSGAKVTITLEEPNGKA